ALQLLADGAHGGDEAGIVVGDEEQLVQLQQARVERIALERRDERPQLLIPRPPRDDLVQLARAVAPVRRAIGEPQLFGDAAESLAADPAHHRRERVDARAPAELPQPGVRLIEQLDAALAQWLEPTEQRLVALVH